LVGNGKNSNNATNAPHPVSMPTMPANFGADDSPALFAVKPAIGEDDREVYRAGVMVSSDEIEGVAP
jgi:hypothetical protein